MLEKETTKTNILLIVFLAGPKPNGLGEILSFIACVNTEWV